jgi:hypothetical protein
MYRLFYRPWSAFKILCVILLAAIALGEGASIFTVLFDDAIGRIYWIEFTNFPTQIVYTEKSWWFGPVRKYLVRPEKNLDEDDEQNADVVWSMRELKGKQLGYRQNLGDPGAGVSFTIRPYYGNAED